MEKLKVAVFGSGAVGTVIGGFLGSGGVEIDLVDREKSVVDAILSKGVKVTGGRHYEAAARAYLPQDMPSGYDVVFLCTRITDNHETVPFVREKLSPDGVIVACQNGIPEPYIAEVVGDGRTLGCTLEFGATLLEPGLSEVTTQKDHVSVHVGKMKGVSSGQAMKVRNLLGAAGTVHYESDLLRARWVKLIMNCSISSLSTIIGEDWSGVTSGSSRARGLCAEAMKEAIDVAHAEGVDFEGYWGINPDRELYWDGWFQKMRLKRRLPDIFQYHSHIVSVMLQDIRRGRKTEVDAINGHVAARGKVRGVPTPVNDRILEIIHKEEAGEIAPSSQNLKLFF